MRNHLSCVFGAALAACVVGPAYVSASPIVVYTGTDANVAYGSSLPNSNAAAASFDAAVAGLGQTRQTIDFEGVPLGNVGTSPVSIGSGVTLSTSNAGKPTAVSNTQNDAGAFNTTPGGSNYFLFFTQFIDNGATTTATATFNFATGIDAFGAYITGLGTDTTFSLGFSDGTMQLLTVPGNGLGSSAMFFGFTDAASQIVSLTLTNTYHNVTGFNNFGYALGVDEIHFASAVPEPTSLVLLGSGLIAFAASCRRMDRGRNMIRPR